MEETGESVEAFLSAIKDEQKQADARAIAKLLERVTGEKGSMWGKGIVGFGHYHYRYASGREGVTMLAGFSARAANLTIYLGAGWASQPDMMKKLGKFSTGMGCLYFKRLSDIDTVVLEKVVKVGLKEVKALGKIERRGSAAKKPAAKKPVKKKPVKKK